MNLEDLTITPGAYLAPAVNWLNVNFHPFFAAITGVVEALLDGLRTALLWPPALVVVVAVGLLGWWIAGLRTALLAIATLGFCLLVGLWEASIETLALVSVAVLLSVMVAFPLGVLAARRPRLEAVLRPILDIMQTVPAWVYLIPAVMIFSLGTTPALIATVVYGIPPMLRLTTLAFRQVPKDLLELGEATGASPRTILLRIELPSAMPTLVVGLNQCILLSLAMVVLAGLVGAGGLGAEVTRGLTRMQMGPGLRAGLAIVAIALLFDRLSRASLERNQG